MVLFQIDRCKVKTWKGYNILDLLLVLIGVIAVVATSIVFKSSWLVIIQSVLCLLTVFTQAKGKIITQFLGIVTFILYMIIAFQEKPYGEFILYLTILIPMYVYGAINWLKNKDKQNSDLVEVKSNLSKKEWLWMFIVFIVVSVGVFFLLKLLNTAQLIISTLSFISMLPALYLLARRCKWNQVAFLVNDIFVIILWIVLVIKGELSYIPLVICFVFQMIYDIYGIFEWKKLEKRQIADKQIK